MLKGHAFFPGLLAWAEIAFQHESHNGLAAIAELMKHLAGHDSLACVIFTGVVVRTIDHDGAGDAFARDGRFGFGDMLIFVVGFSASASQHDMAVGVAHGSDDGRLSVGVDADKMMGCAGGRHCVDSDLEAAFRAVFESDGHGDTACQFAVGLAFRRPGADGAPTDQVGDVLRTDGIEQLGRAGQSELIDAQENRPGQFQARGDVTGAVQVRIVDQTFPSDGGPRFLKIGSHDDQEPVTQLVCDRFQLEGIFISCLGIMDRTRTNDQHQSVAILPVKNSADSLPGLYYQRGGLVSDGKLGLDGAWRGQRLNFTDVLVVDRSVHSTFLSYCRRQAYTKT